MTAHRLQDDAHALDVAARTIAALLVVNADLRAGKARVSYTATEFVRRNIPRLHDYGVDRDLPNMIILGDHTPTEETP